MRGKPAAELMYGIAKAFRVPTAEQRAHFRWLPTLFPLVPFSLTIDGTEAGIPEMPLTTLRTYQQGSSDEPTHAARRPSTTAPLTSEPLPPPPPLILGTTTDEGSIFVLGMHTLFNVSIGPRMDVATDVLSLWQ